MVGDSLSPQAAVMAWWQAWQHRDIEALKLLAMDDYFEYPGAGDRRTSGRASLLDVATRFFDSAAISHWSVFDFEIRQVDRVAICSYFWTEAGTRGDEPFTLRGIATDILIQGEGGWRYQSHHVGLFGDPDT